MKKTTHSVTHLLSALFYLAVCIIPIQASPWTKLAGQRNEQQTSDAVTANEKETGMTTRNDQQQDAVITFTTTKKGSEVDIVFQAKGDFSLEGMSLVEGKECTYKITSEKISMKGQFESLILSDLGISDLSIEAQPALVELICSENNIQTLDLAGAPNLKNVTITYNPMLTSLKVENNKKIQNLFVYNNPKLKEINPSQIADLTKFYASGCSLESLDLSNCLQLENVDVFQNKCLHTLQLKNHPKLNTIIAGVNSLTSINLTETPQLASLYLQENKLTSLTIVDHPNLKTLQADKNNLSTAEIKNCPQLSALKLNQNQLTKLDLTTLPALNSVQLDNNRLSTLTLGGNNKLSTITIYNNSLSESAMKSFAQTIGTAYDNGNEATIDIIDSTLPTEGNFCDKSIVKQLIEKGWNVYDYNGNWANRQKLTGEETHTTDVTLSPKHLIQGSELVLTELPADGASLYDLSGHLLLPIHTLRTDLSLLPEGPYILVVGSESSKIHYQKK